MITSISPSSIAIGTGVLISGVIAINHAGKDDFIYPASIFGVFVLMAIIERLVISNATLYRLVGLSAVGLAGFALHESQWLFAVGLFSSFFAWFALAKNS